MCGIAGVISFLPVEDGAGTLKRMADTISHRGPAGEGYWVDNSKRVNFAHRRLAILDLTEAAAQPLHYLHYIIIFNGEIYNFKELRQQLQQRGYFFTSTGDTEIIPAAYDCWGMDFLNRLDGMFAFALYDGRTNYIIMARDRFGEKPLYYTYDSDLLARKDSGKEMAGGILFASEMKAFWAAGVRPQVNHSMLLNYITLGYVQDPSCKATTFFNGVYSLSPGHLIQVKLNENVIAIHQWYDAGSAIKAIEHNRRGEQQLVESFLELFTTSVCRRLRSDVPIGTSLSGGLDSSAIVGTIQQCFKTSAQNKTMAETSVSSVFSAVFPGFDKDESAYSKQVAGIFNLKQHISIPVASDLVDHWQQMMYHQEEPVQSSSVVSQYLIYALAKEKKVTVLLDGQGADEILGGYKKYSHWYLQQLVFSNPLAFIKEKKLLQQHDLLEQWGGKNYAAALFPGIASKQLAVKAYQQQLHHPHLNRDFIRHHGNRLTLEKPVVTSLEKMLYYNTFVFGLEELLRYADRNSMAHSREVRLPFLSHELVAFIFSLPSSYKIRNGFTKWILRRAMEGLLPDNIVWRKGKIGFEPPQQQWMQHPGLKEMIMDSRQVLVKQGILSPGVLQEPVMALPAHAANNVDWRYLNAAAIINRSY